MSNVLIAVIGLVLFIGLALAGAVVLTFVMTVKAGEEENFLRREPGAVDYDAYAALVRMLVPMPR